MMLGKRSTILKLYPMQKDMIIMYVFIYLFIRILMFEAMKEEKEKPKGLPPKRDLSSLP